MYSDQRVGVSSNSFVYTVIGDFSKANRLFYDENFSIKGLVDNDGNLSGFYRLSDRLLEECILDPYGFFMTIFSLKVPVAVGLGELLQEDTWALWREHVKALRAPVVVQQQILYDDIFSKIYTAEERYLDEALPLDYWYRVVKMENPPVEFMLIAERQFRNNPYLIAAAQGMGLEVTKINT